MQLFFELGLTNVTAQFASHEFAELNWEKGGIIQGNPISRERFEDLLCKTVRWFAVTAVLFLIILIPIGLIFFENSSHSSIHDFAWRLPWTLAVIGTAINLFTTPFFAIIMGSGDVITVNYREMIGAIVGSCISWLIMLMHGGLYAVFAVTFGNIVISWTYLIKEKPAVLKLVWNDVFGERRKVKRIKTISWWDEIWPMQWRMALTWVCGYFVYELFTPVLFHYHGPVIAGQMGMTLSAANALLGVSLTWLIAKGPEFGKLIAKQNWRELDTIFYRTLLQSIVVVMFGAFTGWAAIWYIQTRYSLGERFIPSQYAAILFAAVCVQIIITAFGTYLRAHKKEPLLTVAIVAALLQGTATWLLGKWYASSGVTIGFFTINLFITLPASYFVWKRCRRAWH